ncbi:predicted protein [Botrytis cinerea T4]|uniref:Uncharacterized protein n=1 Tax=Botryotinia fuckeliana (strain T4) TaxID=999810 RepID=G2Y161_BOTF4|nr:predicted protein [Botrytis cinerea T4]
MQNRLRERRSFCIRTCVCSSYMPCLFHSPRTPLLSYMTNFAVSIENSEKFTKASAHGVHQFASDILRQIDDELNLDEFKGLVT